MKYKIIINLMINETITIEKDWMIKTDLLNKMNDGNNNIEIDEYIIPKSSINYIKIENIQE